MHRKLLGKGIETQLYGDEDWRKKIMNKLRVWWIPQVGMDNTFYVPVNTPEEGKRLLDTLAAYDLFQLTNNVKPDFCNTGGLQMWDKEEQEWNNWFIETEEDYFDTIDKYCESDICEQKEALEAFSKEILGQIDYSKLPK